MNKDFAALSHHILELDTSFEQPATPEELVYLTSPALSVFTDFRVRNPVSVEPTIPIDDAMQKMRWTGVRLLLVLNENGKIIGIISATDIIGEKPVNFSEENRLPRSNVLVRDIMMPQSKIEVLNIVSVRGAQVGHIIQSLNELERQHVLVVEMDEAKGKQFVVGLFSISQISRQIGREVMESIVPAHSLAEIMRVFEN